MTAVSSVRLGWQNFGVITTHIWLLRILTTCVRVVFVAAPVLLAQRIVIPRMAQAIGIAWIYPVDLLLIAVSAVLVNSILAAFAVVYDARLFAGLQHKARLSTSATSS